jgi:crotonobetainyl-CoA:carnitine CoA-transferase CaiB-like acyl-CoA transferase
VTAVARKALDGVRVLDFTQMMMGPWATQFLGDMGADVIKVERPGAGEWERGLRAMGELLAGQSPFFLAMNRNKRSLTLNLKDRRAREIVLKLAATCDLVTENFRPGVMDRLGMGYEALRSVNPSIVYVAGTGFGPDGPYVDRPGQDLLIQAMSGLAAYGGRRGDPPTPSGSSIVDASTALLLAFSAMVGLFHRERTGEGQRIDVSLYGTAIALQCQELAAFLNMERRWERSEAGIGGAWLSAPFGIYRTADGHLGLAMGSLAVVGELLGLPELAEYDTPERAWAERDDVYRLIAARLTGGSTADWVELLATRDVWCAPVQTFEEVAADPQVEHNELLATVEYPGAGELRVVGVPMWFSETPGTIRIGPPTVGQHTDEILASMGYLPEEIATLRKEGCV